jgi:O-antigen/teichoic acid export membrane protein
VLALVGSVQVLIQILGFASGLLIINLLSIEEYAFYTLANTMLGTMTVLADGGISQGVIAAGGQVWQDNQALSRVVSTGIYLRRQFARIVLVIVLPILLGLLLHHGAHPWQAFLITLSVVPVFLSILTTTLIQIPQRLRQEVKILQRVELEGNVWRLLVNVTILPFVGLATIALGAAAGAQLWINKRLRSALTGTIDLGMPPDKKIKIEIIAVVKKIMPTSVYFAISSQLTIFLISIFGDTTSLAQIGALGRFVAVLAIVTVMVNTVIVPRFARIKKGDPSVVTNFMKSQLFLLGLSSLVIGGTYLFSDLILLLLGAKYQGLNNELVLVIISGCLGLLSRGTNNLLSSRGIVVPPVFFLIYMISVQVLGIYYLPLSTLTGIIFYGIVNILAVYLLRLIYFTSQIVGKIEL